MKRIFFFLCLSFLCFNLFCCSQEKQGNQKIIAKINDYNLTFDEFQYQLAAELKMDREFKLTGRAKEEFLEGLIRKELLIQEAVKLKLERKEKFIKAIERYWESTLIRNLIDLKANEISKKVVVSHEEVEACYREKKNSDTTVPPIEVLRNEIGESLREKKKSRILQEWISSLRKNANIEINQELLVKK